MIKNSVFMVQFLFQRICIWFPHHCYYSKHVQKVADDVLSLFNRFDKKGLVISLKKSDIEAKYTAGSSKGGQKANKSHSLVQLKHLPTGEIAEGRKSRFLPKNYEYALAKLRMLVDVHMKGDKSEFVIHKKKEEEKIRINLDIKIASKMKKIENEKKLKAILSEEDTLSY